MSFPPFAFKPETFADFCNLLGAQLQIDLTDQSPDSRLGEDLMLDSIGVFEVVLIVEEIAGRVLPDELLSSILTLGDAYAWYCKFAETSPSQDPPDPAESV